MEFDITKPPAKLRYFLEALKLSTDECIEWPFTRTIFGHGRIRINKVSYMIHRLAFYFTHDRWPEPQALHSCDNPPCFNPRHIFEGTQRDNMVDAKHKLRLQHGTGHYRAKLNDDLVRTIRSSYDPLLVSQRDLAKRYGVSQYAIAAVLRKKTWQHVV